MNRTKTLSSRYFKFYKIILAAGFLFLIALIVYPKTDDNLLIGLLFSGLYLFFIIRFWFPSFLQMIKSFKQVSYDQANLYVKHRDYEIQIPFERIKNIELKSLDGLYCFELMDEDQLGKYVYCKPSMWYPFNFPKVDNELDRIRKMIGKRKRERYDNNYSVQLNSFNS